MRLDDAYEARNFMPAHLKHEAIQADLLPIWIDIFRDTTKERCSMQAARVFIDIAEGMADSIHIGVTRRERGML